jgi:DNA-binding transcriptional regulator YhcF (GntR family)
VHRGVGEVARHTGGWVKFWRKAALGDINSNYTRGGLFGALIAMANLQESTVDWGGKPRKLKRGEIVTSIKELADLGETDRRTVDRHLAYLAQRGTITVDKQPFGTFIKVQNFAQYQDVDADSAKPPRNGMLNHTSNHSAHNEELKKLRKKEAAGENPPTPLATEFNKFSKKYLSLFPGTIVGGDAESRFEKQMKTEADVKALETSMDNYRAFLDANTWRTPKQSFEAFLGTKRSKFFWRDYIKMPDVPNPATGGYN